MLKAREDPPSVCCGPPSKYLWGFRIGNGGNLNLKTSFVVFLSFICLSQLPWVFCWFVFVLHTLFSGLLGILLINTHLSLIQKRKSWVWQSHKFHSGNYIPWLMLFIISLKISHEDEWGHLSCSFSDAVSKAVSTKSESQEEMLQIFNIDTHTSKQLRHFKFLSVSFMSQLLASSHFIRKVMCSLNGFMTKFCFFSEGTIF